MNAAIVAAVHQPTATHILDRFDIFSSIDSSDQETAYQVLR